MRKEPKVQIHPRPNGKLCSSWFALAARLLLAASVATFLFPTACLVYDNWVDPPLVFGFDGGRRGRGFFEEFVTFWVLLTTAPAILAVGIWYLSAVRNARRIAVDLQCSWIPASAKFLFPFYFAAIPVFILIIFQRNLKELWQASNPDNIDEPESWKESDSGWIVQTWGASMLTSACLAGLTLLLYPLLPYHLASFNIAVTGVLLSIVIKSITTRQHERYRRLFE